MFAYVVKRLLSGVVVLFLISMSVFLLFWYGPSEPAQTICDNDTSNRCTPARLEVFRENLGFNNPWYEEYGKFMKGVVAGREIQFGSTTKLLAEVRTCVDRQVLSTTRPSVPSPRRIRSRCRS